MGIIIPLILVGGGLLAIFYIRPKTQNAITEIIEISKINGFRNMLRWSRITRMKKVSILRVNFSGTIGTLNGSDMNAIAEKISIELGNKKAN